jgi:Fe-S cluster assembly iron-binding protein IscA
MLAVTERAKQELKRILADKVDNPQGGLRLRVSNPGEFGLSIDTEMPGDQVVKYEGAKVLLVEEGLATSLKGVIIGVEDTPEGPKLAVFQKKPPESQS